MDYFELTERTEKNQRKGIEMVIFFCEIDCEIMEKKSNVESYDRFLNEWEIILNFVFKFSNIYRDS